MISKTMKTVLHALSYGNIEVDSSRKLADLKQLDATRIFLKKLDARVYNGDHEYLYACISPQKKPWRQELQRELPFLYFCFSMEADG